MDQQGENQPQISERMVKLIARKREDGSLPEGLSGVVTPIEKQKKQSDIEVIAESLNDPGVRAEEVRILASPEGGKAATRVVVQPMVTFPPEGRPMVTSQEMLEKLEADESRRKMITDDLDLVLSPVDQKNKREVERRSARERLGTQRIRLSAYLRDGLDMDTIEGKKAFGKRKGELRKILSMVRKEERLNDDEKKILRTVNIISEDLVEVVNVDLPSEVEVPDIGPVEVEPEPVPGVVAPEIVFLDRLLDTPSSKERNNLLRRWISTNGANVDTADFQRAMAGLSSGEPGHVETVEIPMEPIPFRRFMRERMIEVIRNETEVGRLNVNQIELGITTSIRNEMTGADPSRLVGGIELYPRALAGHMQEVRDLVKNEILARANLRQLQLKEEAYKQGNKKNALANYMRDMEGSEGGLANPSTVAMETYRWLKNIDSLGDPEGLTTERVDKAMSILLKLGERNLDFSDPELARFAVFRTDSKNIYDPGYDPTRKQQALDLVAERCGHDARDLAYQLFQAYKEEGNYNKDHYLFGLYQFAEARKNAFNGGSPIGSTRAYVEHDPHGGHENEIPYLALSPLRAQAKTGETVDPVTGDPKDVKTPLYLYRKALEGEFLQTLDITNLKNMPEREAFAGVKEAVVVKTAIEKIGTLGAGGNKSENITEARTQLISIRNSGQELVSKQVLTLEMLDDQIEIEAMNAIWELSIQYPTNNSLARQSLEKPNFLLPSGLVILFERLSDFTGKKDYRIIADDQRYRRLGVLVRTLMQNTYDRIKVQGANEGRIPWHEGDEKRLAEEKRTVKKVGLADTVGGESTFKVSPTIRAMDGLFNPLLWKRK